MLRVLDLFSGIGGMSLGLEMTGGFETVAFCEREPFCQAVLRQHWPTTPIYGDVKELHYDQPVDVVCGGYPCQPFSQAGQRRGDQDDRHLWPEMRRIVDECRPAWVLGENVAGHITLGLDQVLSDLEAIGYASRAFVVPAVAVDAPHQRDRVWIIAHADSDRKPDGAINEPARSGDLDVADAVGAGLQGGGHEQKKNGYSATGQSAQLDQKTSRLWKTEPVVGRVADGVPARVDRIKALGNAVVPQVVAQIGRAILYAHFSHTTTKGDAANGCE